MSDIFNDFYEYHLDDIGFDRTNYTEEELETRRKIITHNAIKRYYNSIQRPDERELKKNEAWDEFLEDFRVGNRDIYDEDIKEDIDGIIKGVEKDYSYVLGDESGIDLKSVAEKQFRLSKIGNEIKDDRILLEYEDEDIFVPTGYNCILQCHEKMNKGSRIISHCIENKYLKNGIISTESYRKACDEINEKMLKLYKLNKNGKFQVSNKKEKNSYEGIILCVPCSEKQVHHAILYKKKRAPKDLNKIFSKIRYSKKKLNYDRQKKCKSYRLKNNKYNYICFFDIETYRKKDIIDKNGVKYDKFIPEMIGFIIFKKKDFENISDRNDIPNIIETKGEYKEFRRETSESGDILRDFIEYIEERCGKSDVLTISHNGGKFDILFFKQLNMIELKKQTKTNNGLIKLEIKYIKTKISFIDSLKIYPDSLKNFTKSLSIKYKKKDYDIGIIQTKEDYRKNYNEISEYLKYDVLSLSDAYLNFRYLCIDFFNMDIFNYLTLGSFALDLNKKISNFDNLYYTDCKNSLKYIRESIYGARVTAYKRIFNDEKEKLICIDYNSLYSSAMLSLYPVGKMHEIENYEDVKNLLNESRYKKFCIVECDVEIPKNQYMPLLCERKQYNVYRCGKLIKQIYNNIDLEEAIKFNDAKITKIYSGVEWDSGSYIFKDYIEFLYNKRKEYKKLNNDIQKIFKTILNSSYGKFLQKVSEETIFCLIENLKQLKNKKKIKNVERINNNYIEVTKYSNIINRLPIYIGSFILSYSKKLMNVIFKSLRIKDVYYSDTDSIYLTNSGLYESKLNEIMGDDLNQFKNDYGNNRFITKAVFLSPKRTLMKFNDGSHKLKFLGLKAHFLEDNIIRESNDLGEDNKSEEFELLYEKFIELIDEKVEYKVEDIVKWMRSKNCVFITDEQLVNIKSQNNKYRFKYLNYSLPINYDKSKFNENNYIFKKNKIIDPEKYVNEIRHKVIRNKIIYNKPYYSDKINKLNKNINSNYILLKNSETNEYIICKEISIVKKIKDKKEIEETCYEVDKFGCPTNNEVFVYDDDEKLNIHCTNFKMFIGSYCIDNDSNLYKKHLNNMCELLNNKNNVDIV